MAPFRPFSPLSGKHFFKKPNNNFNNLNKRQRRLRHIRSTLRSTCFVSVTTNDEKNYTSGGVCVARRGDHMLFASVYHGVDFPEGVKMIQIRQFGNRDDLTNADVVATYPPFDLILLRIRPSEDQKRYFRHVKVPIKIGLRWNQLMFSFSQSLLPFSATPGRVKIPLPRNATYPDIRLPPPPLVHNAEAAIQGYVPIYMAKHEPNATVNGLHPDLPLIKMGGVCGDSGASGCPLFTMATGLFAGILLQGNARDYSTFLPSPVIRKALDIYYLHGDP